MKAAAAYRFNRVDLAMVGLILLLTLAMQRWSGAYRGDMAWGADEPAHAVSSLMVRDYLAQALGRNPLHFASDFYAHYPKVAIGHWPPLFYVAEALWMLVFGRSAAAMLSFTGCCGSCLAALVYRSVRSRFGRPAGCVSGALLLCTRAYQQMVIANYPDALLAVFILAAAIAYARALDRNGTWRFVPFGIFTVAALLTHGRGALLLFLPFAVLPFGRQRLTWRWLVGAAAVLLLCQIPHLSRQAGPFELSSVGTTTLAYLVSVTSLFGWPGSLLALLGVRALFLRGPARTFLAAVSSLVLCELVLLLLLPVSLEDRYLLPAFVALSTLAGAGVHRLLQRFGERFPVWLGSAGVLAEVIAMAGAAASAHHIGLKSSPVYRQAIAHGLLAGHPVTLIDADSRDEGALIVEAALADPRRTYTILRGSKVLTSSTWSGYDKRFIYTTPQAVAQVLQQRQVSLLLAQVEPPREEDVQLLAAVGLGGSHWRQSMALTTQPRVVVYSWTP